MGPTQPLWISSENLQAVRAFPVSWFFLGFAVGVLEFVLNHLFELLRLDPD